MASQSITSGDVSRVQTVGHFREVVLANVMNNPEKKFTLADYLTIMGVTDEYQRKIALMAIRNSLKPGGSNHDLTVAGHWLREGERAEWAASIPTGKSILTYIPTTKAAQAIQATAAVLKGSAYVSVETQEEMARLGDALVHRANKKLDFGTADTVERTIKTLSHNLAAADRDAQVYRKLADANAKIIRLTEQKVREANAQVRVLRQYAPPDIARGLPVLQDPPSDAELTDAEMTDGDKAA